MTLPPAPQSQLKGIVLINKPGGCTSHDVVARMRRVLGTRKIGHAGTLDPMATGLLVLGVGQGTKLLTYLVGLPKQYTATIRLGVATTTDDADGVPTGRADAGALTTAEVQAGVTELTGDIQQVPSAVSAIKINGQRAYARVRAGEQVELAPRSVRIDQFEVLDIRQFRSGEPAGDPEVAVLDVDVVVDCSSGTYVRALARDLGVALGVGGHLTRLQRTRVGPFLLADAGPLPPWPSSDSELGNPSVAPVLMPLADAAARVLSTRTVTESQTSRLRQGQRIDVSPGIGVPRVPASEPYAALDSTGSLIAIVRDETSVTRPVVVFPEF